MVNSIRKSTHYQAYFLNYYLLILFFCSLETIFFFCDCILFIYSNPAIKKKHIIECRPMLCGAFIEKKGGVLALERRLATITSSKFNFELSLLLSGCVGKNCTTIGYFRLLS